MKRSSAFSFFLLLSNTDKHTHKLISNSMPFLNGHWLVWSSSLYAHFKGLGRAFQNAWQNLPDHWCMTWLCLCLWRWDII